MIVNCYNSLNRQCQNTLYNTWFGLYKQLVANTSEGDRVQYCDENWTHYWK